MAEIICFKMIGLLALVMAMPTNGQIITSCTSSMVSSFTPCLSFITNGNGASPTASCCSSLKSLTNASTECACNILTGNVPFQIPINRTMAVSLPKACNSSAVPLQCQAKVTPVLPPAPLPSAISPTAAPIPETIAPTSEPETPSAFTPTSTPSGTGTTTPNVRPTFSPPSSTAISSTISLRAILLSIIGILVLHYN